jgi:hypothetical protein
MPASARNLFLAERMRVARDWDDLLRYAPRAATATAYIGFYSGETPVSAPAERDFDDDAARILDRQAPLALLRLAARNSSLPPNLQLQVARAVWVRSILLNDTDTAARSHRRWHRSHRSSSLPRRLPGGAGRKDARVRGSLADAEQSGNALFGRLRRWPPHTHTEARSFPRQLVVPGEYSGCARRSMNAPLELLYRGKPPEAHFLRRPSAPKLPGRRTVGRGPGRPHFVGPPSGRMGRSASGRSARARGSAPGGARRALCLRRRRRNGPLGKARLPIAAAAIRRARRPAGRRIGLAWTQRPR